METNAAAKLSTLGHLQRLSVFRLLMRRYPDHVPAGELATALAIKPSTMSTYLAALLRDGLVTQHRAGTSLLYGIDMDSVQALLDYLVGDCCRGRPDLCMPGSAPVRADRPRRVLFLCTANSARSIFAEALLREIGGDRVAVLSAGTRPGPGVNPLALRLLQDMGHDTTLLHSKPVSDVAGPFDFVFTVCDQAANEDCPAWEGGPVSGHWGIPDPVRAQGTDAEKALAFRQAYGALKRRIETFAALPFASLDRIALQHAVDDIGRLSRKDPA